MTRRKVLIVGDDLIAWAIRKRFSAMRIAARVVGTAEEALEELRASRYDLVVLDPGSLAREGEAVLGEIPGSPANVANRVAGPREAGSVPARNDGGGATRFVEKPLTIFDLDRVVESLVPDFSEKRGMSRHACNIPLAMIPEGGEAEVATGAGGHPTGVAVEAAEDGLRVLTRHPLVPGQQVRLVPLSPEDPLSRYVRPERVAEVVWVTPDEEGVIAGLRYLP